MHLSYTYNVPDVCHIQGNTLRTCTAVLHFGRNCFVTVKMAVQTALLALVHVVQCIFVALLSVYLYLWICNSDSSFESSGS